MIKSYIEGCIPKNISAEALISNLSLDCYYRVHGIETGSPLKRVSYNGLVVECGLPRGWFLDLDARMLENLDLIRSHGRGVFEKKYWDTNFKGAITHYYLHPHDNSCIIIYRIFHRPLKIFEEKLKLNKSIKNFAAKDGFIKFYDQDICIIFNTKVDISVRDNEVKFLVKDKSYGYAVCFGQLAEKIRRIVHFFIDLEPDITQPGQYLMKDEETEIRLNIRGPREIGSAEIALYGLIDLKRRVFFNHGEYWTTIKFTPKYVGIIPLLVLLRGDDFLYFSVFEVLVLPTAISSPDHRFNGVFVEYIRSMLQRRIFNVVPEEDPRGMMIYHHGFWPRNLYAYSLFCFGFQELGLKMVKTFGYLIEKYRFLFDSYSLYGEEVFSNPLVSISNDGIGFYLFQAGKILLRRPDLYDEDFKRGIEKAITWLNYSTHWNGLLFDKTEAVDHCRSERLVGNPYSQSICMAGLKIISKALEKCGERGLSQKAEKIYKRQLEGFRKLYENIGYFRDLICMDQNKPRLSTYSMPAPGCFLLDPEVGENSIESLISNTMKIIKSRCTEPGNPWAMTGGTGRIGTSYAQLGTVASFLNLREVNDAWNFLNELLKYSESTSLKYILPEGIVLKTSGEEYKRVREEYRKNAPWLYTDATDELPGWPCNPGNLVHMGYYLFITDLICGIYHGERGLIIDPRIPLSWKSFSVKNYLTRYGPVSYWYRRRQNHIQLVLEKPSISADVIIGPLKKVGEVLMNNKKVCFKIISDKNMVYVKIHVPEKMDRIEIILYNIK